jgi:excisionase family DNA binding protein
MKADDTRTTNSEAELTRTWGISETSTFLGCTPGTLRVWVSRRRVPFVRVNRLVRFRKRDLDAWLDGNSVQAEC